MQNQNRKPLAELISMTSLPMLLAGLFLYALGPGIVIFRGEMFNWGNFWMGMAIVGLLLLSSFFLTEFYDRLQQIPRNKNLPQANNAEREVGSIPRNTILFIAVTVMTVGAMVTVLLFASEGFNLSIYLILGVSFLLCMALAVPPLRLIKSGYSELIFAVLLTNLFPGFGYLVQTGEMSDVMGVLTFPLTALFLAMMLALSLETYYGDIKAGSQNLMIRLGWQRGMMMHNLLILFAYLLVGIGAVTGTAWALTWPKLLTLPIALFQIFQIWGISRGEKPRWKILRVTAIATFVITLYLQLFTLWVG